MATASKKSTAKPVGKTVKKALKKAKPAPTTAKKKITPASTSRRIK